MLKTLFKGVFVDERADDYLLMGSPLPILGLLGLYYYFVTDFGPKFMKNREPYKFNNVLIFYNAFQILANLYILTQVDL